MSKPLWTFRGFVTAADNRVVQEWYWSDIGEDDRDLIRDRVGYLKNVKHHLWKEPYYENLGEFGEIKKKTPRGALRIYGEQDGYTFVLLYGILKKKTNDKQGKKTAGERLKKLKQKEGSTHVFKFKEKSDPEDSEE
jgi:hypothetical protein